MNASRQRILYIDFELSDKQFEGRYSVNYNDHYKFSDLFIRAEINSESDQNDDMSMESFLIQSIEQALISTGAKILIVDNITYLRNDTEKAKGALPLMKGLKKLKQKHNLSILALAHTPKRDMSKPIGRNDLQGSKMLINFCDSAFAIGESHKDKSLRYLKQIKSRSSEVVYDTENVILCQLVKPMNFLSFEFYQHCREKDHLKCLSDKDSDALSNSIIELKKSNPSISNRAIAEQLGTYPMKVGRVLKNSEEQQSLDSKEVNYD